MRHRSFALLADSFLLVVENPSRRLYPSHEALEAVFAERVHRSRTGRCSSPLNNLAPGPRRVQDSGCHAWYT